MNSLFSESVFQVQPKDVLNDYRFFSSLYPRLEGSRHEREALSFIKGRLKQKDIRYTEQDFRDMENSHSFSRNLVCNFPGRLPDTLLVAVPLDQKEGADAASDGSLTLALTLALLEELNQTTLPVSVTVVFLGGEHETFDSYPIGIDRFIQSFYPEAPVAVLYLSLEHFAGEIEIESGAQFETTPYWLMEACSTAFEKTDLEYRLKGNEHQVARAGLTDGIVAIEPFLTEGFPAVEIKTTGVPGEAIDEASWIFSFFYFFQEFLAGVADGFPEEWDRHYLFFQFGKRHVIIPEFVYVVILVSLFSGFFLYTILFRNRVKKYLSILLHHLGTLPVIFIVIFLCVLAGTFVLEGVSQIISYSDMWQIKPFLFLCLKSSVAFLLFFLVFRFFRKRYFSIRGSFYTAASMMFLILTTVTLTIIDVSFSYYFAWAFVFSFAYSLMRRRYLKLILLGLAPFWLLMAVYDVFTLPALRVVEVVLFSRITGNLLFALVVLPFVLMLLRLSLLYKHAVGKRQKVQNLILLLFFGVSALVLAGHIYVLDPFTHRNQPVLLEESIDIPGGNRSLVITSPSPIDELSVFGGGYSRRLRDVAGESVIPGGPIPELLSVKQKVEPFLDRRYVILTINFEGSPWKTRARLEGDRQIIVYDGNFPFATDIGEMSAEFFIGNNPPNPLILEFTVPRDTAFVLKLDVIYKQFPYSLTIEGENKEITTFLYVKDEINFL